MDGFTVDVGDLASLRTDLDRARDHLGGALGAMRDVGAMSLGTGDLDRACAEFQQSWAHGLRKISECVGVVRAGIDGTRESYADVERVLTDGLGRLRGAMGADAARATTSGEGE